MLSLRKTSQGFSDLLTLGVAPSLGEGVARLQGGATASALCCVLLSSPEKVYSDNDRRPRLIHCTCGKKVLLVEHAGSPAYLGGLSELAGRSFDSVEEATLALLQLLSEQLGMRSAFLTRITPEENRNEVVASHNAPDGCGILAGAVLPLSGTF